VRKPISPTVDSCLRQQRPADVRAFSADRRSRPTTRDDIYAGSRSALRGQAAKFRRGVTSRRARGTPEDRGPPIARAATVAIGRSGVATPPRDMEFRRRRRPSSGSRQTVRVESFRLGARRRASRGAWGTGVSCATAATCSLRRSSPRGSSCRSFERYLAAHAGSIARHARRQGPSPKAAAWFLRNLGRRRREARRFDTGQGGYVVALDQV